MGPVLIFDKSFLQSISLDESVWLEQFFLTNIIPTFFVETLADIEKEPKKRERHPIDIVGDLSKKTPGMGTAPNIDYFRLVLGNLIGQEVEMNPHRPIIDGGEYKRAPDGSIEIHYEKFPYTAALERWKEGKFVEIERKVAKDWRDTLSLVSFDSMIARITNIVPKGTKLSSLQDIKNFLDEFMNNPDRNALILGLGVLGVPFEAYKEILPRWDKEKPKSLNEFAPYFSYVLKVQYLFYLAMERGLISKDRPSHVIDLSYIYYLPFCSIFVSYDKLHALLSPFFLEEDQKFIIGSNLKNGLSSLNAYYSKFKDEIEEVGVLSFAQQPPKDLKNEVSDLWDFCFPNWRENKEEDKVEKEEKEFLEYLKEKEEKSVPISVPSNFKSDDVGGMLFKHKVAVRKGSWRTLPKGIEDKKSS